MWVARSESSFFQPYLGWRGALEEAGIDYGDIRVELRQTVECRICGKKLQMLNGHLNQTHLITPNEYRDEFPDAEFVSEQLREEMTGSGGDDRSSSDQATSGIPGALGANLSHTAVNLLPHGTQLTSAGARHFGTWEAALDAARVPKRLRGRRLKGRGCLGSLGERGGKQHYQVRM